jgi:hypothetical protein
MNRQHDGWTEEAIAEQPSMLDSDLARRLPTLLRILGAGALVVAMYSFLAKGWESGNDVFRYLLMLGHTGVLTAIGLASGHWLKESKGARLLLTLALVSVPANFAILGAFIFSQTGAADVSNYPQYVAWAVDSLNTALLTSGGAMLMLVPVTLLGFTVLARRMSKRLSLLFLLGNAALLLPLRDPQLIGLMVLALTFCTIILNRQAAHNQTAAKTQEGITALGLQFLPLAILTGRSLWLYSVDLFLLAVLSVTLFIILRQISLQLESSSKLRSLLDALSLIPAVSVALLLSDALYGSRLLPEQLVFPLGGLASVAMIYDISRRSLTGARFYRRFAVAGLLLSMLANLILFSDAIAALACLTVGLVLLGYGYKMQQRSLFGGGILLTLAGIVQQVHELVQHFNLGSWAGLALAGVVSILVASTIESQGGRIKPRIAAWKSTFNQWEN